MQVKPNPKQADNLSSQSHESEPPAQSTGPEGKEITVQTELVQSLLYEVLRVKELIKTYNAAPNSGRQFNVRILEELVSAARESLFNYDTALMKKYYDLLKDCD